MAKNYSYAYSNVVKDYELVKIHFKSITGDVLKFQLPVKEDIQDIENLWNAVEVVLPVLQEVRSKLNVSNHSLRDVALREISRLQQDLDSHLREMFESLTEKDNFERLQSQIEKASNLANPFLIYACESGRIDIIKYLIKNTKIDLSFTSPYGVTCLDAVCSSENQFKQLEVMDLLLNKAKEQKVLDKLLITTGNTNTTALFSAILNPDLGTAINMIDKLITASNECGVNLFLYGQNPLMAALKRDDNVGDMLNHLFYKGLPKGDYAVKMIQEALEFCAQENKFDYAKVIIDNSISIIKQEYDFAHLDIIASAKTAAYNLGLNGVDFETEYENYLTKVLGNNPFYLEEEY